MFILAKDTLVKVNWYDKKILIEDYLECKETLAVYKVERYRQILTHIDVNIQYVMEQGWSNADRMRFYFEAEIGEIKKSNI